MKTLLILALWSTAMMAHAYEPTYDPYGQVPTPPDANYVPQRIEQLPLEWPSPQPQAQQGPDVYEQMRARQDERFYNVPSRAISPDEANRIMQRRACYEITRNATAQQRCFDSL